MSGNRLFLANEFLWKESEQLQAENRQLRQQVKQLLRLQQRQDQQLQRLQRQVEHLQQHNALLRQRVADLSAQTPAQASPPFVKANVPAKPRRKRPGRKRGHAPALRPLPSSIDTHQQVPLPIDAVGQASCPTCGTQLQ